MTVRSRTRNEAQYQPCHPCQPTVSINIGNYPHRVEMTVVNEEALGVVYLSNEQYVVDINHTGGIVVCALGYGVRLE